MEQIQTLSTLRGRSLVRGIFRELRFERQLSGIAALRTCWRICVKERELYRYSSANVSVVHPLGFFGGTSLWLQEIVNRFYFPAINSLVYLGAAILLLIVGAYKFTDVVDSRFVVAGITLEALLLFLMFVIMFFSPADDSESNEEAETDAEESESRQLIREIGEIGSDYARFTVQMDEMTSTLSGLVARQDELIASVNESAKIASLAVSPQPELLGTIQKTNQALLEFRTSVEQLVQATRGLRQEEIRNAVRKEIEHLLSNRLAKPE